MMTNTAGTPTIGCRAGIGTRSRIVVIMIVVPCVPRFILTSMTKVMITITDPTISQAHNNYNYEDEQGASVSMNCTIRREDDVQRSMI